MSYIPLAQLHLLHKEFKYCQNHNQLNVIEERCHPNTEREAGQENTHTHTHKDKGNEKRQAESFFRNEEIKKAKTDVGKLGMLLMFNTKPKAAVCII